MYVAPCRKSRLSTSAQEHQVVAIAPLKPILARRSRADVTQSFAVERHDSLSLNVLKQFYIGGFEGGLEDYTQGHRGTEI